MLKLLPLLLLVVGCSEPKPDQLATASKEIPNVQQDNAFMRMRGIALTKEPEMAHISSNPPMPRTWGLIMDMPIGESFATLIVLPQRTVSMYWSTGGGVIGAGLHDKVWRLAGRLLKMADESTLQPWKSTELPKHGYVRFTVRTFDGDRSIEVEETKLRENHELTNLYRQAHEVIAAIREIEQSRKR